MVSKDIIFPELSYQIIGASFSVFNETGYGLPEKAYQKAFAEELGVRRLHVEREVHIPLHYKGKDLVRYFADFIVERKIIVELKVVNKLNYSNAKQVLTYLQSSGMKLGILIYFTSEGVKYRRVLNSKV